MGEGVNGGLGVGFVHCFTFASLRRIVLQALEAELAHKLADMAPKTHDEL